MYSASSPLKGKIHSQLFLGVLQSQPCPTLRKPMDRSTPGLPVPHHLLELAQTHVH